MSNIMVIKGERNGGKTSSALVLRNKIEGLRGFISLSKGKKDEITLLDLDNNNRLPLMSKHFSSSLMIGSYHIEQSTFDYANERLFLSSDAIIIDEIGMLEVSGGGFDPLLRKLLKINAKIIITVRSEFLEKVLATYNIENAKIVDVKEIENPAF